MQVLPGHPLAETEKQIESHTTPNIQRKQEVNRQEH